MWIDYTRRNDPACVEGLHIFKEKLLHNKRPTVLCFWTKNPKLVGELYSNIITKLRKGGTTILAQVTINPGYQGKMEPGIREDFWNMGEFIKLLGSPEHMRLRFDPIIKGFTTPAMFEEHCRIAKYWGIKRTTVNFMVPEYKNVGKLLAKHGLAVGSFSKEEKIKILKYLVVLLVLKRPDLPQKYRDYCLQDAQIRSGQKLLELKENLKGINQGRDVHAVMRMIGGYIATPVDTAVPINVCIVMQNNVFFP